MRRKGIGKCSCRAICFIIAALVCVLYFLIFFESVSQSVSYELSSSFDRLDGPSFLYGTCPLSRNVFDPPTSHQKKKECAAPIPLTVINEKGEIVINLVLSGQTDQIKSCYARPLHDRTSWPLTWLKTIAVFFSRNDKLYWYPLEEVNKIDDDFVEVECLGYNNFHGRVRKNKDVRTRDGSETMPDIHVIHVRSLKPDLFLTLTTRYLESVLGAIRFVNYQSFGDDYADFVAISTAALSVPLSRELVGTRTVPTTAPRNFYDDPCFLPRSEQFVPRLLQQAGYATLIAEENAVQESTVEYGCDWKSSSSYRPILHRFKPNSGCSFAPSVIDYFNRFIDAYEENPKFTVTRILHNGKVIEGELFNYLLTAKEKLENAYVFFITDAPGAENPTPNGTPRQNLWLSIPREMQDQAVMKNLLSNKYALITPLDIHATIVNITELPDSAQGFSLLGKMPSISRDCLRLPIPLQNCPCSVGKINYTDTGTEFHAVENTLQSFSDVLRHSGCKQWDVEKIYAIHKLEKLPLIEIYLSVRPLEPRGFTNRYNSMDFPIFKLYAEEQETLGGELIFTGIPELSVAIKPIDYSLSTCARNQWIRPFCYC